MMSPALLNIGRDFPGTSDMILSFTVSIYVGNFSNRSVLSLTCSRLLALG